MDHVITRGRHAPAHRRPAWLRFIDTLVALDARFRDRTALRGMGPERRRDLGLSQADIRSELGHAGWDAPVVFTRH